MESIDAMYDEAEKLKDQGQHAEAITRLEQLLEQDPNHVLSHLALAVLYGKVGRPADSVKHGQRACEIDAHDPFNFVAMSVTYQRAWAATQDQQYIRLAEDAMARAHELQGRAPH